MSTSPTTGKVSPPLAVDPPSTSAALQGVLSLLGRQQCIAEDIEKLKQSNASDEAIQQKEAVLVQVASAITLVINHLDVPQDSQFAAARKNVQDLRSQRDEINKQMDQLPKKSSPEARLKLQSELDSVQPQIKKAECLLQEFLKNPSADLQSHIIEQKSLIRSQCTLLERQRKEIEEHQRSQITEDSPVRKRRPVGAFSTNIIQNVVSARQKSEPAVTLVAVSKFRDTEQEQMMFQFMWEYVDYILQNETRLSDGENPAMRWSAVSDLAASDIEAQFTPSHGLDPHLLIVSHFNELSQLTGFFQSLQQTVSPDRIDTLILMDTDRPLFPLTGPQIEGLIPWKCREICKLSRPILTVDDTQLHAYVATSDLSFRHQGLAPKFSIKKLLAAGISVLQWALDFLEAPDNLFVVHAEDKAIPSLFSGMGRKGNKMIATKSKIVKGRKVIWHVFPPNEIEMVLQAYKGCPYFALMFEAEFEGTIFEECPLVMQLYPKTSQKDAVAPFLWHQIHSSLCQSDLDSAAFALQLTGRFKLRLGFKSQEEGIKWFDSVRYDMDALGILFKDERTNKRISDLLEASDSESTASSKSSAAPYRPGPPDQDNMVLYDVPMWMEDEQQLWV